MSKQDLSDVVACNECSAEKQIGAKSSQFLDHSCQVRVGSSNNKEIKRLFDAPCGDFNWMKEVHLLDVDYIGGDIVSSLVLNNKEQFCNLWIPKLRSH